MDKSGKEIDLEIDLELRLSSDKLTDLECGPPL